MLHITKKIAQTTAKRITRAHITKSALAGAYILLVFYVLHLLQSELAVASLGASTYIAFASPSKSSQPHLMIGGYGVGIISGILCHGLALTLQNMLPLPSYIPACALAVFLSMLLMMIMHLEHPPSTALAVTLVIEPNPLLVGFAGLTCIVVLCGIVEFLKAHTNIGKL